MVMLIIIAHMNSKITYDSRNGDAICAFYEDDKRMIYPKRIKEFRAFQRMFAKNIREQGWVENGEKVENVQKTRSFCAEDTCGF